MNWFTQEKKNVKIKQQIVCFQDVVEIQTDAVQEGQRYLIVDDLLATGGTLAAACQLLHEGGAQVVECLIVIELLGLRGRDKVSAPVHSLVKID